MYSSRNLCQIDVNLSELQKKIAHWENLHTEFKEWPIHSDSLCASIVAFANTDGGQLILGISKDKTITGVQDIDMAAQSVDNVAWNNCEPPVTVIQEVVYCNDKTVLVVNIPKGQQRPYRTNRGIYYIRTSSGRRQASREELLRLFQATESLFYDETPLHHLSINDIDMNAFHVFLEETGQADLGVDVQRLLKNWRLISEEHPTVSGIVLFGLKPQIHLPFAQINAVKFKGTDSSSSPFDVKELKGQLLDVIDQAQRFLWLYLRVSHEIKGFEPERKPELPEEALREALVNALVHRDYTVYSPIRLFILDDRIEFHTPGRAPNTVDEEAMRAGVHIVRNPHIYARLSDAGFATKAGSGIRRMIRLVKHATGRDIGIKIKDYEVLFTIPRIAG